MTDIGVFTIKHVGTSGAEIRDPDGTMIAWAATEPWAMLIAELLSRVEREGLHGLFGVAEKGIAAPRKTQLGR